MKSKKKKETISRMCKQALFEKGWSERLITKYLGSPDEYKQNPHYPNSSPMKLFDKSRVEKAEATPEFQEDLAKTIARREKAQKRAQQKAQDLVIQTEEIQIEVPWMNFDELKDCACQSYNDYNYEKFASPNNNNAEFVERLCVNYLRHECTFYDYNLSKMRRKVGVEKASSTLKHRILLEISKVYPQLEDACQKQVDRMGVRIHTTTGQEQK